MQTPSVTSTLHNSFPPYNKHSTSLQYTNLQYGLRTSHPSQTSNILTRVEALSVHDDLTPLGPLFQPSK